MEKDQKNITNSCNNCGYEEDYGICCNNKCAYFDEEDCMG